MQKKSGARPEKKNPERVKTARGGKEGGGARGGGRGGGRWGALGMFWEDVEWVLGAGNWAGKAYFGTEVSKGKEDPGAEGLSGGKVVRGDTIYGAETAQGNEKEREKDTGKRGGGQKGGLRGGDKLFWRGDTANCIGRYNKKK